MKSLVTFATVVVLEAGFLVSLALAPAPGAPARPAEVAARPPPVLAAPAAPLALAARD